MSIRNVIILGWKGLAQGQPTMEAMDEASKLEDTGMMGLSGQPVDAVQQLKTYIVARPSLHWREVFSQTFKYIDWIKQLKHAGTCMASGTAMMFPQMPMFGMMSEGGGGE